MPLNLFLHAARPTLLAAALMLTAFVGASGQAGAQVTVTSNRIGDTYTFDIFNGASATLALVSLDIPANTSLTNFVSPTGFFINYDPDPALDGSVPGNVIFAEDADDTTLQTFAVGTTVGTFSFDSASVFTPFSITALDVNGVTYQNNVVNVPGVTVLAAAPEPATLGLLALAAVPAATQFVRRRRRALA